MTTARLVKEFEFPERTVVLPSAVYGAARHRPIARGQAFLERSVLLTADPPRPC
jgi:hypothetical protein